MSTMLTVPLCHLKASKSNVRKTDRNADIEALAASIETNGLLENLVVRALGNGSADNYEVIAGGRRLAALKLLAKRKKLDGQHPVPCLEIGADEANVSEVSLAENFARVPLHPADQFEAFAALSKYLSGDEIAARFGVSPTFVAQRLKLASVSPRLVAEYRVGFMTLEQLTAFTLSDDRKAQETLWFESPYEDLSSADIRSLLTQTQVVAHDRRVRFVGLKAYEDAGGVVVRDLFDAENEGYLSDSQLLDRLVAEQLEAAAAAVRNEGWSWVEVHTEADLARLSRFDRADKTSVELSDEDRDKLTALGARYDDLVAALEEEDSSASVELDSVSAEIAELQSNMEVWSAEAKAGAGAIVSLNWQGNLHISRGLVRSGGKVGGRANVSGEAKKKTPTRRSGYADSVVVELSAQRTAVLRTVISQRPDLALTALVHAFAEQVLYRDTETSCLNVTASEVYLDRASEAVAASRAASEFAERHAVLLERLPEHKDDLWQWVSAFGREEQLSLLAHCVALTINALETLDRSSRRRDWLTLALAAGVDMRDWWQPTAAFFRGLTKSEILAAVSEGVSGSAARHLDGSKKDRMAMEAERFLLPTRWLPGSLRLGPDR